jgi:nucleoid DNA-binding protein
VKVKRSMKDGDLVRKLAREARLPVAKAQDRLEELVHSIVTRLRLGQSVELPGLGKLVGRGATAKKQ